MSERPAGVEVTSSEPAPITPKPDVEKELREKIYSIENRVIVASETGLFNTSPQEDSYTRRQREDYEQEIYGLILKAREELDRLRYNDTRRLVVQAEVVFFKAINTSSRWWRLFNMYAIHLWAFFIIVLSAVFSFYLTGRNIQIGAVIGVDQLAINAVTWGVIGGLFQDIWYLWRRVQARDYRQTWMIRYISAPFIGGIFGAIIYLIIVAGLVVLSADITEGDQPRALVLYAAAAFAGFRWEWAMSRFEGVASTLS